VYLLYLDESGNPDDPADKHFVLGGAAIFERVTFFLGKKLDAIQAKHFPGNPPIEFHAQHMRSGNGFWRTIDRHQRMDILQEVTKTITEVKTPGVVLFAAVIEKTDRLYGEDAVRLAAEEVCGRFDIFLKRRFAAGDKQRGLLVFAEGKFHQRTRPWVRGFRELGSRWNILRNLSDIPYFASTRETRLLQIADVVSHSVFSLYERRNPDLFSILMRRFDQKDGKLHGLAHVCRDPRCGCPACVSRLTPGKVGDWLS
jgi:hypothetical protein